MGSDRYPTQAETVAHPAYAGAVWSLKPRIKGHCTVAADRGGPIQIGYSIHGNGPIKVVFLIGLAGTQNSWQRQTLYFGHIHGSKYTVLTIDNRGMGESSAPLSRYSTMEMAKDVIEVLDFISWVSPRSFHLVGLSLGGMIAQEIAILNPTRLATLSLISTAPEMVNTGGLAESFGRASMLMPKSLEQTIMDTGKQLFPAKWMLEEDNCALPDPKEHDEVDPPAGGGDKYLRFNNNFQRFQAQELTKRLSPKFTKTGFMMQMVAAGWHKKTDAQLKDLADKVGRNRILCFHGEKDNMVSPVLGKRLADAIKPGKLVLEPGLGHAAMIEKTEWFNDMMAEWFEVGEDINKANAV